MTDAINLDAMLATEFVLGFRFCREPVTGRRLVAVIRKNRPAYLAGLYNGVGGKIEPLEPEVDAMVREFREETGVQTVKEDWRNFGCLNHDGRIIHLFVSHGMWERLETTTDEPPVWIDLDDVAILPTTNNMHWLIPLALDPDAPYAHIYDSTKVEEQAEVEPS